jgi:hypothetical protein
MDRNLFIEALVKAGMAGYAARLITTANAFSEFAKSSFAYNPMYRKDVFTMANILEKYYGADYIN